MFQKLRKILNKNYTIELFFMIFLMTIAGFFEAFSIGLLVPFMSFLVDPNIILNNEYVNKYFSNIFIFNNNELITISLTLIFLSFFIKSLFLLWFNYKKNCYVFKVGNDLNYKIYSNNLVRPYTEQMYSKSSNIISTSLTQINIFINDVLLASLELISELFIISFLILILFFVNPSLSFFVIIISLVLFFIFQVFTKSKLKKWGYIKNENEKKIVDQIQKSHSGIKEILIFLKEKFFIEQFEKIIHDRIKVLIKLQTLLDSPKIILELIAVTIFIIVIFFVLRFYSSISYYLPILGLYVAVSFKLLPALNRIIMTVQRIKRSHSSIDNVVREIDSYNKNKFLSEEIFNNKNLINVNFEDNIKISNVSFKYPNTDKFIFNNLNLEIKKGNVIGIVGKSGEGKSTLVNIICGFNLPSSGNIFVDNLDIKKNLRGWRMLLGYIPQDTYLFDESVEDNITFFSEKEKKDLKKIEESIKISQLDKEILSAQSDENFTIGERGSFLSGGQAQRIALARTIYKDPKILIFDEATSSLDDENEKKILDAIKLFKRKKTIIIISHRTSTLSFCDMIYKIEDGKCSLIK